METMRVALGIVAASCAGCTLVSGWSDLEGGRHDASAPAPSHDRDAEAPDGDASVDAGATRDAGSPPSACPTPCASSEVCCWPSSTSQPHHCATQCASTEYTVTCHDGSDCSDGQVCCIAFGSLRADCAPVETCQSERYVCGGASPTCPSGMTCDATLTPFTTCR